MKLSYQTQPPYIRKIKTQLSPATIGKISSCKNSPKKETKAKTKKKNSPIQIIELSENFGVTQHSVGSVAKPAGFWAMWFVFVFLFWREAQGVQGIFGNDKNLDPTLVCYPYSWEEKLLYTGSG